MAELRAVLHMGAGDGTTLLGLWVRERGVMSLEQAVHKLTSEVASVYGLAADNYCSRVTLQTLRYSILENQVV